MVSGWAETWRCACGYTNSSASCLICRGPRPDTDGPPPVEVAPVLASVRMPPPPAPTPSLTSGGEELLFRVRRARGVDAAAAPEPGDAPLVPPPNALPVFTSSVAPPPAPARDDGPPPSGAVAFWAVAAFIATNILLSGAIYSMHRAGSREPAEILRVAVLAAVAMQLTGGVAATYLIAQRLVRPAWRRGMPVLAGAGGVFVGLLVAQLIELTSRSVSGQPYVEPGVAVIIGDGRAGRLVVAVLTAVILAPLVEELFFRGFLSESVRRRSGPWAGALASSGAFAIAHLRFSGGALVYFFLAGMMMWTVYAKGGLLASIGTHAAFNGSLLIFTVVTLGGPARIVEGAGVSVTVPGGWYRTDAGLPSVPGSQVEGLMFAGPALAEFGVISVSLPPEAEGLSLEGLKELAAGGQNPVGPEGQIIAGSVGIVTLPYGEALKMHIRADGQHGAIFYLLRDAKLWMIAASSGGSSEALADAEEMLATLEFDGTAALPTPGATPAVTVPRLPATRASCGAACDLAIVSA